VKQFYVLARGGRHDLDKPAFLEIGQERDQI
jgi:hypothetical protein